MIIKKELRNKQNNFIIITKHKGNYITGNIGLFMVINILNKEAKMQFINKEAKMQFIKQINEYIMKNIMKNTKEKSALYVKIIGSMQHQMI